MTSNDLKYHPNDYQMLIKEHNLQYKDVLIALLSDRCDIVGVLGVYGAIIHFLAINRTFLNPSGATAVWAQGGVNYSILYHF